MKICILATGRCGSNSLFRCIQEHLPDGYIFLNEPFDIFKKNKDDVNIDIDTPNILIKNLVGQSPGQKDSNILYDWIFQTFDKVILLDRRNKVEQTESFAYHTIKNIEDRHNTKRIYYLNSIPKDVIDKWELNLKTSSDFLISTSEKNSSKIYYYEDIFVNKDMLIVNEIFNYIGIKPIEEIVDRWIISDDKKVRIYKKIGKLI